jgi:hypothetical protein
MTGAPVSSLPTVKVDGAVFTFTQPLRSLPLKRSVLAAEASEAKAEIETALNASRVVFMEGTSERSG